MGIDNFVGNEVGQPQAARRAKAMDGLRPAHVIVGSSINRTSERSDGGAGDGNHKFDGIEFGQPSRLPAGRKPWMVCVQPT
jgi:hypothetical protein